MANTTYIPVIGTILNINRGNTCCSQMMSVRTENGIINFTVNAETLVIDSRQLRPGMQIAAFYDSNLPVPMIFPPQYQAKIVTAIGRNENVMLNYFDGNLVASDGSLQLNLARNTIVKTVNGQSVTCHLGNRFLLVYYTVVTASIPPQTTPRKIILFC
ncbi:MAG: hypothetical protein OSJ62_15190 [Lachnospiraceae bacterium]|nr:hypothetical protein [Lachnospiraceae bacterium]